MQENEQSEHYRNDEIIIKVKGVGASLKYKVILCSQCLSDIQAWFGKSKTGGNSKIKPATA